MPNFQHILYGLMSDLDRSRERVDARVQLNVWDEQIFNIIQNNPKLDAMHKSGRSYAYLIGQSALPLSMQALVDRKITVFSTEKSDLIKHLNQRLMIDWGFAGASVLAMKVQKIFQTQYPISSQAINTSVTQDNPHQVHMDQLNLGPQCIDLAAKLGVTVNWQSYRPLALLNNTFKLIHISASTAISLPHVGPCLELMSKLDSHGQSNLANLVDGVVRKYPTSQKDLVEFLRTFKLKSKLTSTVQAHLDRNDLAKSIFPVRQSKF